MDTSLQPAGLILDDEHSSTGAEDAEIAHAEGEHHIHLPNPSAWPILLSVAILVTVCGLLFIPDSPWLVIVAAPFVLVGILGWALEDPMAKREESIILSPQLAGPLAKFQIGQEVLDKEGSWLGTVQARVGRYIMIDRGGLSTKVYYVAPHFIEGEIKNNLVRLTLSESDLLIKGMDRLPSDLYDESPEPGVPHITGVPLFARGPLSPAQTGHYNYGPNFPGINTDAAGSYHPEEVRPAPQRYVGDRRSLYVSRKSQPSRVAAAD